LTVEGSRITTPAIILSKLSRDIAFAAWRLLWKYLPPVAPNSKRYERDHH
jgi:hypothetical protein